MEYKRYLNIFNSQSDYESQKDEVMDMPHVVLLEDTNEVIFASENKEIDYALEFFTIEALEEGTVSIGIPSSATSLKYRRNTEPWIETSEAIQLSVVANDTIQISCVGDYFNDNCASLFAISIPFNIKGNIMSLLYGDNFEGQNNLSGKDYAFSSLFRKCTTLQNAENLILPAITLTSFCYYYMFSDCTNLISAPKLPATTLASGCYEYMFYGCTSLTTAPELPATILANECYRSMFANCTSLTEAPQLPATTLANSCYSSMFEGCTSLTEAPQLPATKLANYCYSYMFYGCTSLTKAPELPATTLANNCYYYMFYGCISLKEVLELPATTLASDCYTNMFNGCTSLIEAPELPATTLKYNCYACMFLNCSKLNYIKMLATDISANGCLSNWVNGVASSGTFVKHKDMTSLPSGNNGIPKGWTVENA